MTKYTPRHYQQSANDKTWNYLSDSTDDPLIVMPTGSGKSLVIAMLCEQALAYDSRVVVLANRKELLQQNADKIRSLLPGVKVGIYSAGLAEKSTDQRIVVAGIQSVYSKAHHLGRRNLVIVDEAHGISEKSETQYARFIADIKRLNPGSRVVGLTATPYRSSTGLICGDDKTFGGISFEIQTGDLIEQGFLSNLVSRPSAKERSMSGVKITAGEFNKRAISEFFQVDDSVELACQELVDVSKDRKSILVFTTGVSHAESVVETISRMTGEEVKIVTGETFSMEREKTLSDFAGGRLRFLVNVDVLTTGFDAPCIDCIAVMRSTMSPGLFAQIVGRGLRTSPGKENCLVLDFGGNIRRHGSIDSPSYGRATASRRPNGQVTHAEKSGRGMLCPSCGQDVRPGSRACPGCNFTFPVNHEPHADYDTPLTGPGFKAAKDQIELSFKVADVSYHRHVKRGDSEAPNTLRIDYSCVPADGLVPETISEWVCVEHSGFARTKAESAWSKICVEELPATIAECLVLAEREAIRPPHSLICTKDGRFMKIKTKTFSVEQPLEMNWLPAKTVVEPSEKFEDFSWVDDLL